MQSLKSMRSISVFMGVILILGVISPALAQTEKLAILPFKIHADRDLTFLQKGVVDMLTSRLSGGSDKVTLIDGQKVREAMTGHGDVDGVTAAHKVGAILGADQVLYGSLTVLGDTVSIDARVLEMDAVDAPKPFFSQTTTMGDVIPQIDLLAQAVNQRVFGREVSPNLTASATPPKTQTPEPVNPSRMHPEKLLNGIA